MVFSKTWKLNRRDCSLIRGQELKKNLEKSKEEDGYGQGRPEGNEVTLKNANANRQNQVISLVDKTVLRCNHDTVSPVLYFPDNLPHQP